LAHQCGELPAETDGQLANRQVAGFSAVHPRHLTRRPLGKRAGSRACLAPADCGRRSGFPAPSPGTWAGYPRCWKGNLLACRLPG
jgi:hypothetical protein